MNCWFCQFTVPFGVKGGEARSWGDESSNAGLKETWQASILRYFDTTDSANVCLSSRIVRTYFSPPPPPPLQVTIWPQISSSFPASPVEAVLHGEIGGFPNARLPPKLMHRRHKSFMIKQAKSFLDSDTLLLNLSALSQVQNIGTSCVGGFLQELSPWSPFICICVCVCTNYNIQKWS